MISAESSSPRFLRRRSNLLLVDLPSSFTAFTPKIPRLTDGWTGFVLENGYGIPHTCQIRGEAEEDPQRD